MLDADLPDPPELIPTMVARWREGSDVVYAARTQREGETPTTTIIAVLLLGGIQLMAVGVIGEYVGRIYDEVKGRPLYVVRARVNVAAPADEPDGLALR